MKMMLVYNYYKLIVAKAFLVYKYNALSQNYLLTTSFAG